MKDDNQLRYARCSDCGYLMFPVPDLTLCGHDGGVELLPFEEPGQVYSRTRIPAMTESSVTMAMVDFLDGRIRVSAPVEAGDVRIGEEVRLVAGRATPYAFARL